MNRYPLHGYLQRHTQPGDKNNKIREEEEEGKHEQDKLTHVYTKKWNIRSSIRNYIHAKTNECEKPNGIIKEEHNRISEESRKWVSNTSDDNGEVDIKYGKRRLPLHQ